MFATQRRSSLTFRLSSKLTSSSPEAEIYSPLVELPVEHLEALGLFGPGRAGAATADGATARDGELPVNVSGGSLGVGQLYEASGGQKVAEGVAQLRGEAGPRQLNKATTGLAQSWRGFPTATGAVVVLSCD